MSAPFLATLPAAARQRHRVEQAPERGRGQAAVLGRDLDHRALLVIRAVGDSRDSPRSPRYRLVGQRARRAARQPDGVEQHVRGRRPHGGELKLPRLRCNREPGVLPTTRAQAISTACGITGCWRSPSRSAARRPGAAPRGLDQAQRIKEAAQHGPVGPSEVVNGTLGFRAPGRVGGLPHGAEAVAFAAEFHAAGHVVSAFGYGASITLWHP